jgi:hypothetical protein
MRGSLVVTCVEAIRIPEVIPSYVVNCGQGVGAAGGDARMFGDDRASLAGWRGQRLTEDLTGLLGGGSSSEKGQRVDAERCIGDLPTPYEVNSRDRSRSVARKVSPRLLPIEQAGA